VNVLGHTQVALETGRDDPDFVLGAVLPDLASMAGVRLASRSTLGGALGDGVGCHLRADEAFHADARFRSGAADLRRAVAGRGVASGPARAVGHAGWELMLDGTLVGGAAEDAFFAAVREAGAAAARALAPADGERWAAFLSRFGARTVRLRYDEPRWVAERLHAMLSRRARLRLPAGQVGAVADELANHARGVEVVGPAVLADTARTVIS
jgi:hypothetical protein